VTAVAATAPLSVANGSSTPLIAMTQAGVATPGYLSTFDWNAFNTKFGAATQCGGDLAGPLAAPVVARLQSRAVSSTQPTGGQVLKWSAVYSQWEPSADANSGGTVTSVVAAAPLTAQNGTTNVELSIGPASASADGYLASADFDAFAAKYGSTTVCGGDLDGTLASPVVAKIQGIPVVTTFPTSAQVLRYDGSRWAPASLGISDVGGLSSGYLDLSGNQSIAGTKTFSTAPVFGTPLATTGGGTGATSAAMRSVFAGPAGGDGAPAFRPLEADDVPGLDVSRLISGTLDISRGGTGATAGEAGRVFATPPGTAGAPGFRALAATDLPGLDASKLVSGTLEVSRGGTGATSVGANVVFAGPAGGAGAPGFRSLVAADIPTDIAAATVSWTGVTGKPTTLAGYGITDGLAVSGGSFSFSGSAVGGHFIGDGSGLTGVVASGVALPVDASGGTTCSQGGVLRWTGEHVQACVGGQWLNLDNVPPPVIDSVNPTSGTTLGGTTVTVLGSNFQALATVSFGSAQAQGTTVVSGSQITAVVPPGSAGVVDVKVTNPDFLSGVRANAFTYVPPPTVTSVLPAAGPVAGGTNVTITGTAFRSGATVKFGTLSSSTVVVDSATQITASIPAVASGQAVAVTVRNDDAQTATGSYTYYDAVQVFAGSTSAGTALAYQYSPTSSGYVKANWTSQAWATKHLLSVGTTSGGSNVLAPTDVGTATSYTTASTLSLTGAWGTDGTNGPSYYVTIAWQNAGGTVVSATSGPLKIAETASWDGSSTTGLRNDALGGFSSNFPTSAIPFVVFGRHYFETVSIGSGTTVRVQPFGKYDSIGAGGSTSNPKDGWLGLHANSITVNGVIDAHGRGYGGGPGLDCWTGNHGQGGANGLSGNGGYSNGGAGSGGGGGGGGTGGGGAGAGGALGGGGGGSGAAGAGSSAGSDGSGGAGNGLSGGALPFGGGPGQLAADSADNRGGSGGAGYGAGGGGGTDGCCGTYNSSQIAGGGGAGGTGGYRTGGTTNAVSYGAGPAGGSRSCGGGYGGGEGGPAAGAPSDLSPTEFALGSGGAGGNHISNYEGGASGGGGGAGGGAVLLYSAGALSLGASSTLRASGGAGGGAAGNCGACFAAGGGGGGAGGTVVVSGLAVNIASGATIDTRGGSAGQQASGSQRGNGGDGASQTVNGGALKVFYRSLPGLDPATAYASTVRQVVKTAQ